MGTNKGTYPVTIGWSGDVFSYVALTCNVNISYLFVWDVDAARNFILDAYGLPCDPVLNTWYKISYGSTPGTIIPCLWEEVPVITAASIFLLNNGAPAGLFANVVEMYSESPHYAGLYANLGDSASPTWDFIGPQGEPWPGGGAPGLEELWAAMDPALDQFLGANHPLVAGDE